MRDGPDRCIGDPWHERRPVLRFRLGFQLHVRSGPGGGDERHPLRKHAGVGHLRRLRRSRKLGRLRFQNRVSISGRFHLPRRTSCQGLRVRRLRSGQRFQHGQEELPALFQDQAGQTQCKICPVISGRPGTTFASAARSATDCKERCPAGKFYSEETATTSRPKDRLLVALVKPD